MVSGGVSANNELRLQMAEAVKTKLNGVNLLIPAKEYTTDNAAMIAAAAFYISERKKPIDFKKLQVDAGDELK